MTEMTLLLAAALVVVVAVGYAHSLLYSGKVVLCEELGLKISFFLANK